MKKIIISTLATIALAVPLGIGALTFIAPVTATDAAAGFVSAGHHFNTCSRDVIWECDRSIQVKVLGKYRPLFISGALPYGSNGRDQDTHGTYNWWVENNYRNDGDLALQFLREYFSDRDVQDYNARLVTAGRANDRFRYPSGYGREDWGSSAHNTGHISPDFRERWQLQSTRIEQARARAIRENTPRVLEMFMRDCEWNNGSLETSGNRTICRVAEGEVWFTGYQPESPEIYADPQGNFPFDPNPIAAEQITPITPLGSLSEIEDIADHQQATSDNRGRIVELQEEVTEHNAAMEELQPMVERNTQIVESLGNSVSLLGDAVRDLTLDTAKNTAGVALSYALDTPGLSYGKKFAITGALGQFRGESAVGFNGTFKAGENVLISVGGGFAGSGDSSVTGGKVSATYEW